MAVPSPRSWYHKSEKANSRGWPVGVAGNLFGCTIKPTSSKFEAGIRFIKIGTRDQWRKCSGVGTALVNGKGAGKGSSGVHPYVANLNGGNSYSSYEKTRKSKGLPLCWDEQSKVVVKYLTNLVTAMNNDPWVKSICGNRTRTVGNMAIGLENKGGSNAFCMSEKQTTRRVFEYTKNKTGCKNSAPAKAAGANFPNNLSTSQCQSINVGECYGERACSSNHAAGRAIDFFTYVGSWWMPDPYYLPNWTNSCNFARYMFFTENAHRYFFSNITNEYWHWQFNNPLENPEGVKSLLASNPPDTITSETGNVENEDGTVVTDERTVTDQPVVDDEPNVEFQEPQDDTPDGYDIEEYTYSSLEAVRETLPPLSLERNENTVLVGLKYLTDDNELILLDRYRRSQNTDTRPDYQDQFGENQDTAENLTDNSTWSSVPSVQEDETIRAVKTQVDELSAKKNAMELEYNELKTVLDEYKNIIEKQSGTDEIDEDLPAQFWDKIKSQQKNPEGNLNKTLEAVFSNGKNAEEIISDLTSKLNRIESSIGTMDAKINSLQKQLEIKTEDLEEARSEVEKRVSNYINSSGIGTVVSDVTGLGDDATDSITRTINSGSLKEFDLYDPGDKVDKLDIKLKKLTPPKLSDLATILAGGLSFKSLLSSLSSFSLPGLGELDDIAQYADQAKALYDGDLSTLTSTLGDVGALDAINSFEELKSLQASVGSIIEEGKKIYEQGKKYYDEGKAIADKASKAYKEYENLKKQGEAAWKEGGRLWNEAKAEVDNLRNEAGQLLEEAKNLPGNLRDAAIAKANQLELEAKTKIESLKKEGQVRLDSVKKEYDSLKTQSEDLLNKGKTLLEDPKVVAANEAQAKLDDAKQSVDLLKDSYSGDVVSTIESAVEKKQAFDTAINKVISTQKALLNSKEKTNITKEPVKHFPKDFRPFSEWVLARENEVLNIEVPQGGQSTTTDSTQLVTVEGSPTLLTNTIPTDDIGSQLSNQTLTQSAPVQSNPYIIYRGATGKINNPTLAQMNSGTYTNFGFERIPTQFKSYFDFGKSESTPVNLKKLFDGYLDSIMSPIDVALLLNPGNVGMFNNVAPYGFGEGSELAAAVTFQKTTQRSVGSLFSKGGIGTEEQPNWAYNPEWAGLYLNFLLEENGVFQSDEDFLNFRKIANVEKYVNEGHGLKLKNTAPLTEIPRSFPGAVIAYFDKATRKGHAELLLRTTIGGFITLAGNIQLDRVSKFGATHGFKTYYSLKEFSPSNDVYIIKRGKKNGWTVNGRLDGRIKRTPALNEYMLSIENSNSPKNTKLFAEAYNILRGNVSDSVYTRTSEIKLTQDNKLALTDQSFNIHTYNDIYLSGSIDLNNYKFDSILNPSEFTGGH
jgi:uncharacterized protein YoxC